MPSSGGPPPRGLPVDRRSEVERLRAEVAGLRWEREQFNSRIDQIKRQRDTAVERQVELEARNGVLRSQNRRFKVNARILVTELEDSWWLKAAEAHAHLEALLRDDLDP